MTQLAVNEGVSTASRTSGPLLRGHAAERARGAVSLYSRALLAREVCEPSGGPTLAHGDAGLALVHATLESAFPGRGHAARADEALARALRFVAVEPASHALWDGFTGVGWVATVLGAIERDDDSPFDAALTDLLEAGPWRESYDLIGGLAGIAVYALERLPHRSAARLLEAVVDRLAENAEHRGAGVAWRSDVGWLPLPLRAPPHLDWNLGMAHGVPGVVSILARIQASDVPARVATKARALLDGAVAWLLAAELPRGESGCFPLGVGDGVPREPARSAWCYGDPGVAAALMVAGQCAREPLWIHEATRIALVAAARAEVDSGVKEAGLCHGGAGLGHVFHGLYSATGDARIGDAARAWLERALDMIEPDAPYLWTELDETGRRGRASRPGLITGGGGVALALLAASGEAEAPWCRALGVCATNGVQMPSAQRFAPTPAAHP